MHRIRFGKMKKIPREKSNFLCISLSLDCLDARGQAQRSLAGRCVIPRLREKGLSKGMLKSY
jgi:hypothetical protein